jgi:hypothetical protein
LLNWGGDSSLRDLGIEPTDAGLARHNALETQILAYAQAKVNGQTQYWEDHWAAQKAQNEQLIAIVAAKTSELRAEFAPMSPLPAGWHCSIEGDAAHVKFVVYMLDSYSRQISTTMLANLAEYEAWRLKELALQEAKVVRAKEIEQELALALEAAQLAQAELAAKAQVIKPNLGHIKSKLSQLAKNAS